MWLSLRKIFGSLSQLFHLALRQLSQSDAALPQEPKSTGEMWLQAASGGLAATEVVAGGERKQEVTLVKRRHSAGTLTL